MINKLKVTENSIETIICEPMQKKLHSNDLQELTDEDAAFLIALLRMPKTITIIEILQKKENVPFLYELIEKRIPIFQYTITDARLILLLTMITQTPGSAIIYLWFLQYWAKKHEIFEFDLEYFCKNVIPWGHWKEDFIHGLWQAQKTMNMEPPGENRIPENLVDYGKAGFSLLIENNPEDVG